MPRQHYKLGKYLLIISLCWRLFILKYFSVVPGHLCPASSCTFSKGSFFSLSQLHITLMRMVCGLSFLSVNRLFSGSIMACTLSTDMGLPSLVIISLSLWLRNSFSLVSLMYLKNSIICLGTKSIVRLFKLVEPLI